jgi:hypothetical protein
VEGDTVYAGGTFTHSAGPPRSNLGAVDVTSGIGTAFSSDPDIQCSDLVTRCTGIIPCTPSCFVESLALDAGGTLYAGGNFDTAGGQWMNMVTAFDTSGHATGWTPHGLWGGSVGALVPAGGSVYLGGGFIFGSQHPAGGLAMFDQAGKLVIAWAPALRGAASALEVTPDGTAVYYGGDFRRVASNVRTFFGRQPLTPP